MGMKEGHDWRVDAACAQNDPEHWFPASGGTYQDAKRICQTVCTVRAECLELAMSVNADDDRFGIFGGLSPKQRSRLRSAGAREEAA